MNGTRTPRVEIPPFPGAKRIAVTISFDDGHVYDRRIVAAFNQWGLKATFNLNSGRWPGYGSTPTSAPDPTALEPSEIAALFSGHEVAIHTVNHPHLAQLDPAHVAEEVFENRRHLEDLVGYPVRGMAYPFGTYSPRVMDLLRSLGVAYARTTRNEPDCFPPQDPLAWHSTAHQYAENPDPATRFAALHANPRYCGVFFIWGHGYEFEQRNDWAGLERIYKPLSGKPDVWYCTNIELFDYEAARQRVVVAANGRSAYNPNGIAVTLRVDGRLVEASPGATVSLQTTTPPAEKAR